MDATAVRTWARANGFTIGDRGRIKEEIMTAYLLANGVPAEEPPKTARIASSPQPRGAQGETVYVARPLATPGVAESYGPDPATVRGVAQAYVPNAQDLTDDMIARAMRGKAAIVNVGGALKLYRDTQPPAGAPILLDWRQTS